MYTYIYCPLSTVDDLRRSLERAPLALFAAAPHLLQATRCGGQLRGPGRAEEHHEESNLGRGARGAADRSVLVFSSKARSP